MYPAASQPGVVPMQPARSAGFYPGQPDGSTVVHLSPVNVSTQRPRDYIIYSLFSFVYMGNPFCLGLAALIFSIKARDRKVVGDIEGAKKHASTAKYLNIAASIIFGILVLIVIITYSVVLDRAIRGIRHG
ncbi:dispanin subfamily A member 2b-like isoform X2 [Festucalex cinctus]